MAYRVKCRFNHKAHTNCFSPALSMPAIHFSLTKHSLINQEKDKKNKNSLFERESSKKTKIVKIV